MKAWSQPRRRMMLRAGAASAVLATAGCAGVPLRTIAKLRSMRPADLLEADPREFRVAFDVDARVHAAAGKAPALDVVLTPEETGAAVRSWTLPLVDDPASAVTTGLPTPAPGRHWLVWRLSETGSIVLVDFQREIKAVRARGGHGSIAVTVRREWVAAASPVVVGTRVHAWARLARGDEFVEIWSGRVPDVLRGT